MPFMYCKHHCNRAGDKYKCHYTHKCKREVYMSCSRKCIEHDIRIGPKVLRKANGAVRNEECSESESITHQEVPHHQFAIFYIERTSAPVPPFGLLRCC